jgi:hypothetical protein
MLRIVSRSTGQRDLYAARMQEVSMRSFASAINEPMLFQISDELPNLARHTNNIISEENCQEATIRGLFLFSWLPIQPVSIRG